MRARAPIQCSCCYRIVVADIYETVVFVLANLLTGSAHSRAV